ncbi:MAG: hypothetical protein LBG61_01395 [Burkholderiales bacterium]|jgi:hypothetical protein|nr:hypothetical protein [Burkholderiales bacterium]
MLKKTLLLWMFRVACLAALGVSSTAFADICAYENADGKKIYTDQAPGYGWKKRQCFRSGIPTGGPKSTVSQPVASGGVRTSSSSSSSSLPRVSKQTQTSRDFQRRQLLQEELAAENKLLEDAVKLQVIGFAPTSSEELANPQIYTKRVASLNEDVTLHERNIEALKKELSR